MFQFNKSDARATGNAYLSVYSTNGGGAPDTLLGQESLAASAVGTTHSLVYFDLTSLNISVSAGDLVFAALSADFNGGMHSTTDLYADGREWGYGPALLAVCWTAADNGIPDLVYRSHVEPLPTSGTLALFGLGLAGLGIVRRRHST